MMEYGPMKLNDDLGNGFMMLFADNCVQAEPLTEEERKESPAPTSSYSPCLMRNMHDERSEMPTICPKTALSRCSRSRLPDHTP
jgi:hypothetical protein